MKYHPARYGALKGLGAAMAGLPNFRQIFALSRTADEDRRIRWTAVGHGALFVAFCITAALVRDGVPDWAWPAAAAAVLARPAAAVAAAVASGGSAPGR